MARILVIDDDAAVRNALEIMLEGPAYSVEFCATGKSGLEALRNKDFDLVISDVIMPETDGLEVLFAVKKDFPLLKVILISGGGRTSASEYLKLGNSLGADGVVQKPFTLTELIAAIETTLEA